MNLKTLKKFVRNWWESNSLEEVCERMPGLDRRGASNLAADLRRHDVDLKHMVGNNARKDDEKLVANDYTELRLLAGSLKADMERRAAIEADTQRADRVRRRVSQASAYSCVSERDG